jgi:2-aminomuconate deaminase
MDKEKTTISDNAPKAVGAYPHSKRVGNLLFLSGIGARNPKDNSIAGLQLDNEGNIVEYDFEAQVHQVFYNVKAVLEDSGAKWEDLIDITVFLINMKRDFSTFNKLYAQYFTTSQPCRTTVEINSLPTPIAIELKCIAVVKD